MLREESRHEAVAIAGDLSTGSWVWWRLGDRGWRTGVAPVGRPGRGPSERRQSPRKCPRNSGKDRPTCEPRDAHDGKTRRNRRGMPAAWIDDWRRERSPNRNTERGRLPFRCEEQGTAEAPARMTPVRLAVHQRTHSRILHQDGCVLGDRNA